MKRLLTLAVLGLALSTVATGRAYAQQPTETKIEQNFTLNLITKPDLILGVTDVNTPDILKPKKAEEKKPEPPKPVEYVVVDGDNLTKIAEANKTTWKRLWDKNTQLANQDVLKVGEKLIIPTSDEVLADRPIVAPPVVETPAGTPRNGSGNVASSRAYVPSANYGGGNTYDYGYCTWYVKNRRGASLPNNLGNANTWYSRAAGMGMAVGSTPRAGAVGTTTRGSLGHVVYVESVNGDGTINISEMNYQGFGVVSSRTTSASEFVYIY